MKAARPKYGTIWVRISSVPYAEEEMQSGASTPRASVCRGARSQPLGDGRPEQLLLQAVPQRLGERLRGARRRGGGHRRHVGGAVPATCRALPQRWGRDGCPWRPRPRARPRRGRRRGRGTPASPSAATPHWYPPSSSPRGATGEGCQCARRTWVLTDPVHIVVVGCGRVGSGLAVSLTEEGHTVAILDRSAGAFRRLRRRPGADRGIRVRPRRPRAGGRGRSRGRWRPSRAATTPTS